MKNHWYPQVDEKKIVVVMPAYNAAQTLHRTYQDIPLSLVDEIILVDDCSRDDTVRIAQGLVSKTLRHDRNKGYGGNQKTCYDAALESGADIVVMLHPDYQYDGRLIPFMVGFIALDICDIVLGSRIRTRQEALNYGMPPYKYFSNRFLSITENLALGQNLSEWHTGYRAYSRKVLETIPYHQNSDNFVFDTEFLVQAVHFGFRMGDVPVPVRYMPEASSINFLNSVIYGTNTLATLGKYYLHRLGFKSKLFEKSTRGSAVAAPMAVEAGQSGHQKIDRR